MGLTARPKCNKVSAANSLGNGPAPYEKERRTARLHAGADRNGDYMILGLGMDLVELPRMERIHAHYGLGFAERILHPDELALLPGGSRAVPYLASRFAAKEAAVKALGTGFRGAIGFQAFCVRKNKLGRPGLEFYGEARETLERLGAARVHLSLTHGRDTAAAVVILEKE